MADRAGTHATRRAEFRVLGPIELRRDDVPVGIGSAKQRALLGVLLLYPNQVLSTEALLDELWSDEPPASASKMLQILVSRIRKNLDARDAAMQIVTRTPGYIAQVAADRLDSLRFQTLARRGIEALPQDPASAIVDLETALGLWRGEPLADISCGPRAQAAITRLEQLRLAAAEARIDAGFALGRHAELTSDLADLVRMHPFRERFAAQLMVGLYRTGRQAEALEVYRRSRTALRDELGIEPGAELRALEADILNQDLGEPATSTVRARLETPPPDLAPPGTAVAERPPSQRGRHRSRAAWAGAVAVVIVAGVLLTVLPDSRKAGASLRPRSLAVFDASTMRLTGDIAVGANPGAVAVDGTTVWVANRDDRTVTQVDLGTRSILRTVGIGRAPLTISIDQHRVWIGDGFDGTLTRILSPYNQVSSPFFPGPSIAGLLAVQVSPDDLWVGLANDEILRLDPTNLHVKSAIAMSHRVFALAADSRNLWSIAFQSDDVSRIDPARAAVNAVTTLQTPPHSITVGGGSVWVTTADDDRLWRINPSDSQVTGSVPLGNDPGEVVYGAGAVWVSSTAGVIDRIDPSTMELVRTVRVGHNVGGMASFGNDLLITVD